MDTTNQVKDPVCGMQFAPERAAGKLEHNGQVYYFCNPSCLEKFRTEPERFLSPASPRPQTQISQASENAERIYTCPMDPEVRQKTPGPCRYGMCGTYCKPARRKIRNGRDEAMVLGQSF
jgi:Cu+-exporting ATPase